MLLAIARKMPIIGDIITAVEGKADEDKSYPRPTHAPGGRPAGPNRGGSNRSRYNPEF